MTENYAITYVDGTLTVTKDTAVVAISSEDAGWIYDGQEHTNPEYVVTYGEENVTENEDGTFTLPTGDTITITCTASVKYVADTGVENNLYTYVLENADQYETVTTTYGDLEITERELTITADSNSKEYDGEALTDDGWKDTAPVGVADTDTVESVTVTGSQTLVGESQNVASNAVVKNAAGEEVTENYAITYVDGTLTVTGNQIDEPVKEEDETSGEFKTEEYKLGDKIPFTITVHNITVNAVENIIVTDPMAEIQEGEGYTVSEDKHTATIAKLESDAKIVIIALHTVTSDDILEGEYKNTASVKTPDGKEFTAEKLVDKIDELDPTLTVTKKSDVKDGETVALDQIVTYTITVTNAGNVPFYNVTVDEDLEGLEITAVEGNSSEYTIDNELRRVVLDEMAVGEVVTITATYTATSDDILKGTIVNHVTANADKIPDPDGGDKIPEDNDKEEDETDDVNDTLTVVKTTVDKQNEYKLGETIKYEISVKNDGNVPYYNVVVTDVLEGVKVVAGEGYELNEAGQALVAELPVGEEVIVKAEYTVTSDDILNGKVINEAIAKAEEIQDPKDPEHPKTPEGEDDEENVTEDVNAAMSLVKETTSTAANEDGDYRLGEMLTYDITVKNEGNVPYYNVVVTDTLIDAEIAEGEGYAISEAGQALIEVLAVGESIVVKAQYEVAEKDILAGTVKNNAVATADPIDDPKNPEEPKVPTDEDDEENPTHTHYDYKVEHYLETEEVGVYEETPYETDEIKDVKFMDPAAYEAKDYEAMGYRYDAALDDVPSATVPANDDLVIKLYYARRTDLKYTIEFWYEESIGEETKTYEKKAEQPDVVVENVRLGDVIDETNADVVKAAEENVIYNYELEKIEGVTIAADEASNIVRVYYDRQMTSYKVEYYFDNYCYEELTETYEGICGEEIMSAVDKNRPGFKLVKVTPNALGHTAAYEGATVDDVYLVLCEDEEQNVIRLYYKQQYTVYWVYYYYDGVRDTSRTYTSSARPQGTMISEYPDQQLPGYRLDHVEGIPCVLVEDQFENSIHVYYVSEEPTETAQTAAMFGMGLNVGECCE